MLNARVGSSECLVPISETTESALGFSVSDSDGGGSRLLLNHDLSSEEGCCFTEKTNVLL